MAKKKKSKKEKQSVAVNKDAAISRFRNRIMSDETVKYIYSEKESILHDKHCLYAKEIPDSDLFYEKQYLPCLLYTSGVYLISKGELLAECKDCAGCLGQAGGCQYCMNR